MITIFKIVFVCASINCASPLYCYWNTGCPYKLFSSITPYSVVRGDIRDAAVKIQDCEPISLWSIHRNGKTHPGPSTGNNMKNASIVFKQPITTSTNSSLCAQDKENIRHGVIDNDMLTKFNYLSIEGYQEMLGLGKRIADTFPHLLRSLENRSDYEFLSASGHWVDDSAKAFIYGLTEGKVLPITEDDAVAAPYQGCKKYVKEIFSNIKTYDEVTKFIMNSTDYQIAKDRIQRRSGISGLTSQDILNLYDLCRYFWSGLNSQQSPWCALFTTDDLKVLEYVGDLIHYYRNGYGNPMYQKLSKPALNGLLTSFQLAKEGKGKKIVGYFTHVTMMDMIYSALGLFRDNSVLSGVNRIPARQWRSSYHSCFSANLMAVLNRCKNNGKAEYNVVFYLNEKLLALLCGDGVCTWDEFVNMMKPFSDLPVDVC